MVLTINTHQVLGCTYIDYININLLCCYDTQSDANMALLNEAYEGYASLSVGTF